MELANINDPSPVWEHIKQWLTDDMDELTKTGQFVGVFDGGTMAGAFCFKPWSTICYEVHGGVHPDYFGRGLEVCCNVGKIFFCSPCLKLVAPIPEYNEKMIHCVELIGMKREGVISKAFLKNFKLHDLILYGITKNEFRTEQGR